MGNPFILLFTPGNRRDFILKASSYNPDGIIIDLEDAVPRDLKEKVRREVGEMIPELKVRCVVRINSEPEYLEKDLNAVVSQFVDAISIPKTTLRLIRTVDALLDQLEKERGLRPKAIKLHVSIETPYAVLKCYDLSSASERIEVVRCSSGEEGDLQTNLKCGFAGLYYARSKVLLDARAAGVKTVMDGVFSGIHDEEGLRKDCVLSRELGYDGRVLIHPRHIPIAREVYSS